MVEIKNEKAHIEFDPHSWPSMRKLMDDYGDSEMPFFGTNSEGEDIMISIFPYNIVTLTYQKNKHILKNIYNREDYSVESIFGGKWEYYKQLQDRIMLFCSFICVKSL